MESKDRIVIGSDHAGYRLKEFLKEELANRGIQTEDVGAHSMDPKDDYPIFAGRVADAVASGSARRGIALCGSGIGASITANRRRHVRAALCLSVDMARSARSHNDANVLVMGERLTDFDTAREILSVWLETPFSGERHARRLDLLDPSEC